MDTLETQIETLRQRHAEDVAKLARAEKAKAAILARWPECLVKEARGFAYCADAWTTIECDELCAAIAWAERMNPEALFRVKDGSLSFRPEYATPEGTRGDVTAIGAYYLTVDKFSEKYPLTVTLTWYVIFDGLRTRVDAEIKNTRDFHIGADITYDRHGNPHCRVGSRRLIDNSGQFTKTDRYWAPEDSPGRYVRYVG